jgi:L-ascorbate metabolism protein UlaG (beta-lactamase superfamily)
MKVKWLGHSCFLITSDKGLRIITDPYTPGVSGVGYAPINEAADIVTVSHEHFDHNDVHKVPGKPEVVRGSGIKNVKGIEVTGVATHHDNSQGKERGDNVVYCFSVDGIKLCHLGDLGHKLSKEQIAEIGAVDILLIPVGGFFTIDAKVASKVCDELKPRVIIPMHYKTPKLEFPIAGVEDFVAGKKNVKRLDATEIEYPAGKLPDATEIVVLKPAL